MKTRSRKMSLPMARMLINARDGMQYPDTLHNKKQIAKALDGQIAALVKGRYGSNQKKKSSK